MQFWSILPSFVGPTDRQIILGGRFAEQLSDTNKKGRTTIVSSHDVANNITYLDHEKKAELSSTMELYWLPWQHGEITTATLAELNQSGCQYFLTSTFSGCRFVVTNESVSHVAFSQNVWGHDSTSRDLAELFMPGPAPTRRRKLSITGSTVPLGDENSSSATYGTGFRDGIWQGNAVVLGYRTGNEWHFKALIYSDSHRYWFTLN